MTDAALTARPNGRDLRISPARTDSVRRTYAVSPLARAMSQKVGSDFTRALPRVIVRPAAVTRTAGIASSSASRRAASEPDEEERLRRHLGVDGVVRDDRDPQQVARRRLAGGGIDDVVELAAAAPPAAAVASGRRECAASRELERERPVGRLDRDRPDAVPRRDVSAGVHEARPGGGEDLGGALARVALADPAEVDLRAAVQRDDAVRDLDPTRARPSRRLDRALVVGGEELERAVVTGGEEGVVDVDVEAAAGSLTRRERELDDAEEVRPGGEAARGVEPRELRLGPETREQRLEPVELLLRRRERAARRRRPRRAARCPCPSRGSGGG